MHHCSMSLGNIYLNLNKLDEAGRCFALALNSENPRTLAGAYHYLYLLEKKQKSMQWLSISKKSLIRC